MREESPERLLPSRLWFPPGQGCGSLLRIALSHGACAENLKPQDVDAQGKGPSLLSRTVSACTQVLTGRCTLDSFGFR